MLSCIRELKYNCKLYMVGFSVAALSFTHWQRVFLPRGFYIFAGLSGLFAGAMYGVLKTSWFFVETIDKLGKDYELSRILKQDIFDTRPDLDSGMRAQYYMHQQKQNE